MRRHPAPQRNKRTSPNKAQSSLRIIGGQWRGRRLPIADIKGLRPTPDHLRETLFNWLMFDLAGARCLDAFAGSGALGTEALSREAKEVVFIEKAPQAAQTLQANMNTLSCTHGKVMNADTLTWLKTTPATPFDIVFLDPPFRKELLLPTCKLLQQHGWIASGSYIYVEMEKEYTFNPPANWHLHKEKATGQIISRLYIAG